MTPISARARASAAESGNILFIILIAVCLLAALTYAVINGRNDMAKGLSRDAAHLTASEMLQYGDTLRLTLDKMIALGATTDSTATLFAETANANYGAPGTAASSELFNTSGGAVTYMSPSRGACSTTCAYEFTGQIAVGSVGTDPGGDSAYELSMIVLNVDPVVCSEINNIMVYGSTVPTDTAFTLTRYSGTYGATAGNQVTLSAMAGKRSYCYKEAAGGQRYIMVYVLRTR